MNFSCRSRSAVPCFALSRQENFVRRTAVFESGTFLYPTYARGLLEQTTNRYNGYILSADFEELSFLKRQKRVFNILRPALGADVQSISMLFTYTPEEYAVMEAS